MYAHISVLLNEVIEGLAIKEDGTYVDATLGGAGHSYHILSRLKSGHLYGFDQDAAAIETSRTRLQTLSQQLYFVTHQFRVYQGRSRKNRSNKGRRHFI